MQYKPNSNLRLGAWIQPVCEKSKNIKTPRNKAYKAYA
jgi:hypothetical protein